MAFVHLIDPRKRRGFPAVESQRIVLGQTCSTVC